jgi:hypothetical protein
VTAVANVIAAGKAGEKKAKDDKTKTPAHKNEEEKVPGDKKPSTAATTKLKAAGKVAAVAVGTGKKGSKDDDDDPIEKSLNERIKAGGVT